MLLKECPDTMHLITYTSSLTSLTPPSLSKVMSFVPLSLMHASHLHMLLLLTYTSSFSPYFILSCTFHVRTRNAVQCTVQILPINLRKINREQGSKLGEYMSSTIEEIDYRGFN